MPKKLETSTVKEIVEKFGAELIAEAVRDYLEDYAAKDDRPTKKKEVQEDFHAFLALAL